MQCRAVRGEDEDSNGGNDDKPKSKGGLGNWVEQKKAQVKGGAGGAVVGGLIAGPLGAFVGAQVGTRLMPALDSALKDLEGNLEQEERKIEEGEEREKRMKEHLDSCGALEQSVEPAPATDNPLPQSSSASEVDALKTETHVAETAGETVSTTAAASTAPAAAQVDIAPAVDDVLSVMKQSAQQKQDRLEAQVQGLTAKAEEALLAGDEVSARAFLESRAAVRASLEELQEGRKKRAQVREEECIRLQAEVDSLYAKAAKMLLAGDESGAREFLAQRETAKVALEQAQRNLDMP